MRRCQNDIGGDQTAAAHGLTIARRLEPNHITVLAELGFLAPEDFETVVKGLITPSDFVWDNLVLSQGSDGYGESEKECELHDGNWKMNGLSSTYVTAADSTDSCCATCLAQPRVGSADALDFTACAAAQTTCCFDKTCQPATFGPPTYDLTLMTFADTETRFPAGNWLRMQWTTAVEVKYLALKTGQPKTTQVTNASVAATPKGGGFFFVCPALEGKLYLRAFAHNGCTASNELSITATKDNNRRSVMAAAATTPLPTNHPTGRSTSPQYTDAVHMTTPPVPTKKQLSFRDFHHVPTSQHAPLTQVRLAELSSMDDRQHRAPSPLRYDDDEESLRSSVSDGVLLAGYHHDAETADGRTSHEFTL
ncbi:hypothetical protein DYB34_009440 [Aphanomyces astaci]|uniref:Uncharacterized protein n=1 Tax=Aphanomyces astaci TaxID=112090 RepID=A0A3R6W8H8_APHAT|nr:hypothetical protein DYB34_009440 [Aphanomyces astaci]